MTKRTLHATDAAKSTKFRKRPLPEVFWERTDRSGECWEWQGRIGPYGYGLVNLGWRGTVMFAHRFAFDVSRGCDIPDGFMVCHRCDNRKCVRPDHLFLGTAKDNNVDKMLKGRGLSPRPHVAGEHNHQAKINDAQRDEICRRYAAGGVLQRELAAEFGLTQTRVSQILQGDGQIQRRRQIARAQRLSAFAGGTPTLTVVE